MSKLLHICLDARHIYPQMDGIGRYIFNLLKEMGELTKSGNEYKFSIIENEAFVNDSILRSLSGYSHFTFVPFAHRPFTPGHLLTYTAVNSLNADVYHYTQFDLPPCITTKIVTTIHDMNPQLFNGHFEGTFAAAKQKIARLQNGYALKKSDFLITISDSTSREMLDFYGQHYSEKAVTVYSGFGAELREGNDDAKIEQYFEQLKKTHNLKRYFLYVGNNRPHKNLINLLEAFSLLKQQAGTEDLQFLFIGKHYPQRFVNVTEEATRLGIQDSVRQFSVTDTELAALYRYAGAFVFCSLSEGFGFPLLEAMSFGTPVICSNISSLKEIAGEAALQVNPLSIPEITSALETVISPEFNREEYRTKGLKRCGEFTWRRCAEQTLELYRRAIEVKR